MASIFENVELGPKIEVFALNKAYLDDPSPVKVNLGVGGKLFTSICTQFVFFAFVLNLNDNINLSFMLYFNRIK